MQIEGKPRVGVIGTGRMGQFHVNVLSEMPEVQLAAVSDVSPVRGRAVAEKYRVKYFGDYLDMLPHVDVVCVAVPTPLHHAVGMAVLGAGKHAIIEKPVTNNYQQAKELFDLAAARGVVLHVGHIERFNGAVQELHKLAPEPLLIQCSRMGPFDPRVKDDSVVLDLMIHDIDIVLGLVNAEPAQIHVIGTKVFSQMEDAVDVQVKFANGTLATFTASRVTQFKTRLMNISCKEHFVSLNFADQEIHVHRLARAATEVNRQELKYREELTSEKIFVHRDNPLRLELRHLIACAKGEADRRVSVKDELRSLEMALRILELCRGGQ